MHLPFLHTHTYEIKLSKEELFKKDQALVGLLTVATWIDQVCNRPCPKAHETDTRHEVATATPAQYNQKPRLGRRAPVLAGQTRYFTPTVGV
ncbi:hypothetical protein CEXT_180791 [Caerostris extrusa]|uniref:Uncharacterized protein n=1 Tax=Caerostris extrusa TaxID=172846 RepID=A0AAV4MC46_CAEEX|nr:hypothetical protein CEXT_180791 [Caerostris extrusa]